MIGLVGQGLCRRAQLSFRRVVAASKAADFHRLNSLGSVSSKATMSLRLQHVASEHGPGLMPIAGSETTMDDAQKSTILASAFEAKACCFDPPSDNSLSSTATVTADSPSAMSQPHLPKAAVASNPVPPAEPGPEECCGNGCTTCVWTDYWTRLQAYEEAKRSR